MPSSQYVCVSCAMGHFRKIDVAMWNDDKFTSLSVHGKLAWVMMLTHPMMTALGAMRQTPRGLAYELACGSEGLGEAFREAIDEIINKGMADYDPKASLIALPNFLKYNRPESPNVVKAWGKAAEFIPESPLKDETIQRAKAYAEGLGKGFGEAFQQAFPKASAKSSPKASRIQRTESREQKAVIQNGHEDEELVPTHARETIHKFKDKVEAGVWLKTNSEFFPGDPQFDREVDRLMREGIPQADLRQPVPSDSFDED